MWHIWDLTYRMDVTEYNALMEMFARVELEAKYEVLTQVLSLLYEAEKRGIGVSELKDVIVNWLIDVEDTYTDLFLEDTTYKHIIHMLEDITKKKPVKEVVRQ